MSDHTFDSAIAIGTLGDLQTFADTLDGEDTEDFYRFTLEEAAEVEVTTTNFSTSLQIGILADSNNNNRFDDGETLFEDGATDTSDSSNSTESDTAADNRQITASLDAGTYWIRVLNETSETTDYTLEAKATPTSNSEDTNTNTTDSSTDSASDGSDGDGSNGDGSETSPPEDRAGNSRDEANSLGILNGQSRTLNDYIGAEDTNDYYRFQVSGNDWVDLQLEPETTDADVDLTLLDRNGNQITTASSDSNSIRSAIASGTYFARVSYAGSNTNYELNLEGEPIDDNAGNTQENARSLNILSSSRTFQDFVGNFDTDDYYRFEILQNSDFAASIDQLSADADIELLKRQEDGSTQEIADSINPNNQPDSIELNDLEAGTYFLRVYQFEGNTDYNLEISGVSEFSLNQVSPDSVSNAGQATIQLDGSQFSRDSRVSLIDTEDGEDGEDTTISEIDASEVTWLNSGTLAATFNLQGVATGTYDVKATNNGSSAVVEDSLTVTSDPAGQLEVSLSTPTRVRRQWTGQVTVTYKNDGNTDVVAPLLSLEAEGANLSIENTNNFAGDTIQLLGINQTGMAGILSPGTEQSFQVFFQPQEEVDNINFSINTVDSSETIPWNDGDLSSQLQPDGIEDEAWEEIWQDFTDSIGNTAGQLQSALATNATQLSQLGYYTSDIGELLALELQQTSASDAFDSPYPLDSLSQEWIFPGEIAASVDDNGNVTIENSADADVTFQQQDDGSYESSMEGVSLTETSNGVYRLQESNGTVTEFREDGAFQFSESESGTRLNAFYGNSRLSSLQLNPDSDGLTSVSSVSEAANAQISNASTDVLFALVEPNDIIAPSGFGEENWIGTGQVLPYRINFENDASARANAVSVEVTQQLDEDVNWNSFSLGDFGFGEVYVDVPENRQTYSTRVAIPDSNNLLDFEAEFNPNTGEVTWNLQTIDPDTGNPPEEATAGFLPPNEDGTVGEAFVSYTVRSGSDVAEEATVDTSAEISFDGMNRSIETTEVSNAMDAQPPTSSVNSLPQTTSNRDFRVSWSGNDDGSGIRSYDVYVSTNDQPFVRWKTQTEATSATFSGSIGNTYRFYSVARDNVGLTQSIPDEAQASVRVTNESNSLPDFSNGGSGGSPVEEEPEEEEEPQEPQEPQEPVSLTDPQFGTDGDDSLVGDDGNNPIIGMEGNDRADGGMGRDWLGGNLGNDLLLGEAGDDSLYGGRDNDSLLGGEGNDSINGNIDSDISNGNLGDDSLWGSAGDDSLYGGRGDDWLQGDTGNDRISGDLGDDTLVGVDPEAEQPGLAEQDVLEGKDGSDRFVLGNETQVYYDNGDPNNSGFEDFAAIVDWQANQDTIVLQGGPQDYQLVPNSEGGVLLLHQNELIATIDGEEAGSLTLQNSTFVFQ
jgi:Ca2+-binding RTX toxin-like protein